MKTNGSQQLAERTVYTAVPQLDLGSVVANGLSPYLIPWPKKYAVCKRIEMLRIEKLGDEVDNRQLYLKANSRQRSLIALTRRAKGA
jgi:hypothetical protein